MVVESEIIYIRSRFSPFVDPQKFSSLPIQTLSTSSIAQVERTQRSGETRGFRIIQEACSMNERLHKSAIFTKLFRALYLRTEEAGVRRGEGDHRATDYYLRLEGSQLSRLPVDDFKISTKRLPTVCSIRRLLSAR